MSREDPKPGRWILPLVLAGIVGFTYVFVNSIPPAPVTATTLAAGDTTPLPTATSAPTSTTTLDPLAVAFNAEITRIQTEAAELITEAQAVNDRWDDGTNTFTASRAEFETYRDTVATFSSDVAAFAVPESLATQWADVTAAATGMADAAAAMFTGFIDPESSAGRRQGLDDLKTAGSAIQTALTAVATAAAG
jgi:hypothetical protein